MLPRVFLLCVPILVALEHAFQVPAFWLRSGCVLEHQQPGGDTRKVAGREVFWGFSARTSRGGCRPPEPPRSFFWGIFDLFCWAAFWLRSVRSGRPAF